MKGFKSLKDRENVDKKISNFSNINAWFRLVLERFLPKFINNMPNGKKVLISESVQFEQSAQFEKKMYI